MLIVFFRILYVSFFSAICWGGSVLLMGLLAPLVLSIFRGHDLVFIFRFDLFPIGFLFGGLSGFVMAVFSLWNNKRVN